MSPIGLNVPGRRNCVAAATASPDAEAKERPHEAFAQPARGGERVGVQKRIKISRFVNRRLAIGARAAPRALARGPRRRANCRRARPRRVRRRERAAGNACLRRRPASDC